MEKKLEIKKNENSWVGFGFITIMTVILLITSCIIPTAKADPPPLDGDCQAYAYTESGDHYFLLGNNKTLFGNNLTISHNCDFIEIYYNDEFAASTSNNLLKLPVDMNITTVEIKSDNFSYKVNNITILPDRLEWQFEFYDWQRGDSYSIEEYITISAATAQKNWASILSIVVVFSLVTQVYWHLINAYIDKNYFEEVVR
tara:strand:+ start:3291 stop:3890 length:600 start_codon:yes stop_codon:yes gene_type:complete